MKMRKRVFHHELHQFQQVYGGSGGCWHFNFSIEKYRVNNERRMKCRMHLLLPRIQWILILVLRAHRPVNDNNNVRYDVSTVLPFPTLEGSPIPCPWRHRWRLETSELLLDLGRHPQEWCEKRHCQNPLQIPIGSEPHYPQRWCHQSRSCWPPQ